MEMRILGIPRKRRALRGPDENIDQFTNAEQVKDISSRDLVVMVLGALIALIKLIESSFSCNFAFFVINFAFSVIIVIGGFGISVIQAMSLYSRFSRRRRALR
jgi:hypothetical protein